MIHFVPYLLLVLSTMIWGMGFIATKWTLVSYGPIWSNAIRFMLAGLVCLPYLLWKKSFTRPSIKCLKLICLAGAVLAMAMTLQTIGLKYTSASKSGFITTLYAVLTPIYGLIFYKKRYDWTYLPLIALAMIGLMLLFNLNFKSPNIGDLVTILSAMFFALHIWLMSEVVKHWRDPFEINSLQCLVIGVLGVLSGLIFEGSVSLMPIFSSTNLFARNPFSGFVLLSFFSSILAFTIQAYAQKRIAPHRVCMLFLLESPFACLFGRVFLGETLSAMAYLGGVLVLLSVGLTPRFAREREDSIPQMVKETA